MSSSIILNHDENPTKLVNFATKTKIKSMKRLLQS